jgi:hypothetical protein
LLILFCTFLSGCLEFKSVEQPSSILPGESFTVLVEVTVEEWEEEWSTSGLVYFGICLPVGWIIPGDTIEFTGVSQGSIIYDPNLSLEQENISPAPEGYYWWLGNGVVMATDAGEVFADVPIQADLQPGRYSLNYLLDIGYLYQNREYSLSAAERSDQHIIEVVDEWTPRELNALPQDSSVVLTWLPPLEKEGLAGYRVYRDGELVYTLPAETTEILDEDLAVVAVYHYSVSAVYSDATEHLIPYEIEAWIFSGGTGEPNDPYQIALADQLFHLADHRHLWDKAYVLVNDINLHPDQTPRAPFSQAVIHRFAGIFDGNDHTISNLMITGWSYLGLFGRLESSAQVFDLNVIDVNMIGSHGFVGGLADYFVGGLAGYNDGSISGCYVTGIVNGYGSTGGLVGRNHGSIANSYSTGTVIGSRRIGGLVGSNREGIISNSYSTGTVSGEYGVGGLVGNNWRGSITASYNTGTASGELSVGGLVGENSSGNITTSYSTGTVSGTGGFVGGLVGDKSNSSSVASSFWDMETSGFAVSGGGTGRTTTQMQTASTFLNAGWDFVGETANGTEDIWWIDEGKDYPRLWWEDAEQ